MRTAPKWFGIYTIDQNGVPGEREAGYDSIEDVRCHKPQTGGQYQISVGGRFMTRHEFEEWVERHAEWDIRARPSDGHSNHVLKA
jgi:hypothetical protein